MLGPMTAPRLSCSRRRCRCTTASVRAECWRCSTIPRRLDTLSIVQGTWHNRLGADFANSLARRAGCRRGSRDGGHEGRRCPARGCCAPDAAGTARSSADDPVPPRSASVGRTLRQQRLAAGTAAAPDKADLGQSAARLARTRSPVEAAQRRRGAPLDRRCQLRRRPSGSSGAGPRLRRCPVGLRPTASRRRRNGADSTSTARGRPAPRRCRRPAGHRACQHRPSQSHLQAPRRPGPARHARGVLQGPALPRPRMRSRSSIAGIPKGRRPGR